MIESKNYSGTVVGDGQSNEWVQMKRDGHRREFYSPVLQNKGHIDALREMCARDFGFIPPMLSLLVFPDRCELQVSNLPVGLRCCRFSRLGTVLSDVLRQASPVLVPGQVRLAVSTFYSMQRHVLPPEVQKQHMKDVAAAKMWARGRA